MKRKRRTTSKQRAASRRNLEIARRVKARGKGGKKGFKKAYKAQRKLPGMSKSMARNVAWGSIRHD